MAGELSREELLNKIERAAHDYEKEYHGCARCTFLALKENLKLGDDAVFLAATPLAAGIAFQGETCGALLGGLLAVGLATASLDMADADSQRNSMASGYHLFRRFVREIGSSRCRDIQTVRLGRYFNIFDPADYEKAQEAGIYEECPKVVGKAARLTANFILEIRDREKASG